MSTSILAIGIALILNAADIVTGFIGAVVTKTVKSGRLRDGIFKKFGFVVIYVLAFIIDYFGDVIGFELGVSLLPIVVLYVAVTEIASILENATVINPDLADTKLMSIFDVITSRKDGEDN